MIITAVKADVWDLRHVTSARPRLPAEGSRVRLQHINKVKVRRLISTADGPPQGDFHLRRLAGVTFPLRQ